MRKIISSPATILGLLSNDTTKYYTDTVQKRTLKCHPAVKDILDKLIQARQEKLKNITQSNQSMDIQKHRVPTKEFPKLTAVFYGGRQKESQKIGLQLAKILNKYGITLIGPKKTIGNGPNCIGYTHDVGKWPQDYMMFCESGPFVKLPYGHHEILTSKTHHHEILESLRKEAPCKLYKTGDEFSTIGAAIYQNQFNSGIRVALALMHTPELALTHIEGGNILIGNLPQGKRYAIVGNDSIRLTRYLIENERRLAGITPSKITQSDILNAFKYDLGVEEIIAVEQPGSFHLDTRMAIIGPKTVLLNDSLKALEVHSHYLHNIALPFHDKRLLDEKFCKIRKKLEQEGEHFSEQEWKELKNMLQVDLQKEVTNELREVKNEIEDALKHEQKIAVRAKEFEDVCANELEKNGFKVIRVPGYFHDMASKIQMNFFNMLQATVQDDKKLVIIGGFIDPFFQKLFEGMFETCGLKVDYFEYIDYHSMLENLTDGGGIACRTNGITTDINFFEEN